MPERKQTPVVARQEKARRIREEKQSNPAKAEAPEECLTKTRDFITYIFHPEADIGVDEEAQDRWLSEGLLNALRRAQGKYRECVKKVGESPEELPGNGDFVGSWDYPTGYSILGSRLYGERAAVDLLFTWGEGTQYPGDTRLVSYIFTRERGSWKLDDIYTFRGEFTGGTQSLGQAFVQRVCP